MHLNSSYVKNSGLNAQLNTSLKKYTATRWNSIYVMFSEIVRNFDGIYDALMEKQRSVKNTNLLELITILNRDEMSKVCTFLEPFNELSKKLEGDKYETLHMVWPTYLKIFDLLREDPAACEENDVLVERMKDVGRTYFLTHEEIADSNVIHKKRNI